VVYNVEVARVGIYPWNGVFVVGVADLSRVSTTREVDFAVTDRRACTVGSASRRRNFYKLREIARCQSVCSVDAATAATSTGSAE